MERLTCLVYSVNMAVGVCFDESTFMLSSSKNVSMSVCVGSRKNAAAFFLPESFKGRKKAKQLWEGKKEEMCRNKSVLSVDCGEPQRVM